MAKPKFTKTQEVQICQEYTSGISPTILSKKWKCSFALIFNILKRNNIKTNKRNRPPKTSECRIIDEYINGAPTITLATKYKCSHGTIDNILKENNVYRKPKDEPYPPEQNFKKHYKILTNGCWQWTGYIQEDGYARFQIQYPRKHYKRPNPKRILVHRFSYMLKYGDIPKGKHLHHICHNRSCVNPDHLQVVAKSKHPLIDKNTITSINSRKTHCKRGHPLSGDNVYLFKSASGNYGRQCRICKKLYHRKNSHNSNPLKYSHKV